jgi:formate hydrogenlyase subunit 6/NADH:ubiquinone oxidoreductase subunit I
MKPMSYFALLRIECDKSKCISCSKCKKVCPMNVDMTDNSRKRKNGTECILCAKCVKDCPTKALDL